MKNKIGRKKGSYSFIIVSMGQLNKKLGEEGYVVVSKKFADSNGIVGQPVIKRPVQLAQEEATQNPSSLPKQEDSPLVNVQSW